VSLVAIGYGCYGDEAWAQLEKVVRLVDGLSFKPNSTPPQPGSDPTIYFTTDSDMGTYLGTYAGGQIAPIGGGSGAGGDITGVTAGTGISGGGTTGTVTVNVADTAVTPGTYTLSTVTIDQQGRITSAANGSAASTLQGAYEGGNTITGDTGNGSIALTFPPDMAAITISQAGCVMVPDNVDMGTFKQVENCAGITLSNPDPSSGIGDDTTRPSPPLRLIGSVYDSEVPGSRTDEVRIYNNPLDNGSDDARFTIAHKMVTGEWREILNVIHQYPFDETILNNNGLGRMCAYVGGTEQETSRGDMPFWCLDGTNGTFKQGPSLGSSQRWATGAAGMIPENNGVMSSGGAVNNWLSVYAWQHITDRDNFGASDPETGLVFKSHNGQPSTTGAPQHSGSIGFRSLGFSEVPLTSPTYKATYSYIQGEPVQQTSAHPTSNMCVWTRTETGGFVHRACFLSTQATGSTAEFIGGGLAIAHLENMGAEPAITAGTAANCAGSATVTLDGGDLGGFITVTTGVAACAAGTIATVTYANPYDYLNYVGGYSGAPRSVTFEAANSAASTVPKYWDQAGSSTTAFKIATSSALTAETEYKWAYKVIR
jgi:hypothetical protein